MSEGKKKKMPAEEDGGDANFQTDDWEEADGGGKEAEGKQMRGREGVMRPVKNEMKKANGETGKRDERGRKKEGRKSIPRIKMSHGRGQTTHPLGAF